jgi:hypothetical protein
MKLFIDMGARAAVDDVDIATRDLYVEIAESGLARPRLIERAAPAGSKAGAAVAVGAMAVTLLPVAVSKLVDLLAAWIKRSPRRTVRVRVQRDGRELEVTLAGNVDRAALMRAVALIDPDGPAEAPAGPKA